MNFRYKREVKYLILHSEQFKLKVEEIKINIWKAAEDKNGYHGKKLRALIKEIENNPRSLQKGITSLLLKSYRRSQSIND